MPSEKPQVVKASISSKMLVSAYEKFRSANYADEDGYPDVMNRQAFVDTFTKFCKRVAKRKGLTVVPDQVYLNVIEAPETHQGVRYAIVIENEERLMGLPRTYSLIMLYKPTNEAESISTISDEEIKWSADNDTNTNHHHRTMYYVGFASLMADKTPGFDKEPEPEQEMNLTEFMAQAQGNLPAELVKIPGEETQEQSEDETEKEPEKEKDYASEWHNGKTKEQENQEETESYNDIVTQFEDVESEFDY